nr:Nif3-like dinuclear metal center hexameric protein [Candidatus Sigynarchaeum springense]
MKASELLDHFHKVGTWVTWNGRENDKFLFGDPETTVKGIAVAWMATMPNLLKAKSKGCNVFITHEPLYVGVANQFGIYSAEGILLEEDDAWVAKAQWLEKEKIVVLRCHDTWDDFPDIGIHGAWAKWLGFTGKPLKQIKFYEVHGISFGTFDALCKHVQKQVRTLGQDVVLVIGDPAKKVSKVAIGTGAITNYRLMHGLGADVLVLTDDGTRLWESAQWAEDTGVPVIVVNHATAEEPGMRELGKYLQSTFPKVPVHVVERGCLYRVITK